MEQAEGTPRRLELDAGRRLAIAARLPDELGVVGDEQRAWTTQGALFALDTLDAALLADLPEVLEGETDWIVTQLQTRGVPSELVARLLDALARLLDDARAAALLVRARDRALAGASWRFEDRAPDVAARLADALCAGRTEAAVELLAPALWLSASSPHLADALVGPAMREVGRRWFHGDITVADEHRASLTVQLAYGAARRQLGSPKATRGVAVVAAVEGNTHALAPVLLADALRADGWNVVSLGGDVPTRDLVDAARRSGARLVALSLAMARDARAARDVTRALAERAGDARPRVLVGGPAVERYPGLARVTGADAVATTVTEAVAWARSSA